MTELKSLYMAIKQRLRLIYAKGLSLEEIEMELRLDIEQVLQLALSEDLPELCNYYKNCDNDSNYDYIDEENINLSQDTESEEILDLIDLLESTSLDSLLDFADDDSEE